jgi:hypothetical protein
LRWCDQRGEAFPPSLQPFPLAQQHADLILALEVEQVADLAQRRAKLAMEQDALQAQELLAAIVTIAVLPDVGGLQQSDLIVMVQRAHRHP